MKLTRGQAKVLANALAWCAPDYEPTDEETENFFAHNDRGKPLKAGVEIQEGWTAHYGNPFKWIGPWEAGKLKNPPASPPAAWIYDAYFSPPGSWMWWGWGTLLLDFICDSLTYGYSWERMLPAYTKAYKLAAYFHGHLPVEGLA